MQPHERQHGQQHWQEPEVLEQLIIEQAMRRAKQAGWTIAPDDCFIQGIATEQALRTRRLHAWIVYMTAQPGGNSSVQQPLYLRCRVELLDDRLYVVEMQEPAEQARHVL